MVRLVVFSWEKMNWALLACLLALPSHYCLYSGYYTVRLLQADYAVIIRMKTDYEHSREEGSSDDLVGTASVQAYYYVCIFANLLREK